MKPAANTDLVIESERTVVEIQRGAEVIRLTHTVATTPQGKRAWHSLRLFYRDDRGEFRPGKAGLTIRHSEIAALAHAMSEEAEKYGKRP